MKETLSASKIKVLKSCSWQYWCKYGLKLPDKTNDGALKGSIVHLVLECLGNPRHKKHYDQIVETRDMYSSVAVNILIEKHAIKNNLMSEDHLQDIYRMALEGVLYDFFGKSYGKPSEIISEKDFELEIDEGDVRYKVKGFIDKLFIYKKKGLAVIRDFKTNKKIYEGEEVSDNLQDYIYTLAVKKLYPQYKDITMEFVFLKHSPDNGGVLKMEAKTDYELNGFEFELTQYQKYADSFTEETAKSNYAYNQGMPKDGSFSGRLLCGFAKSADEKKKDGSPKWYCTYKFGFDYYVVIDKDGNDKKSYWTKKSAKLEKGEKIQKRSYGGCPCFNSPKEDWMSDFEKPSTTDDFDLDKF